jgi:hypothetical protein
LDIYFSVFATGAADRAILFSTTAATLNLQQQQLSAKLLKIRNFEEFDNKFEFIQQKNIRITREL